MRRLLVPAILGASAALALTSGPPSIGGEWKIQYNVFGKEGELACVFTQAGSDAAAGR
jgi:hypothetical protein